MDSQGFDPTNPMHVGMRIIEMQGHLSEMKLLNTQSSQNARNAFESLQSDVHKIGEAISQIALLAERQTNDSDSIKRIWQAIERTNATVMTLNRKLWTWAGMAIGFSLVATAIASIIVWVAQGEMNATSYNDERIDRLEIHLAGDQDRPYQRK